MRLHFLPSETGYLQAIEGAAHKNKRLHWTCPKSATPGEPAFFLINGTGVVAAGVVDSRPTRITEGYFSGRYGAWVSGVRMLPKIVPLPALHDRFPNWGYPTYPRAYATIESSLADQVWKFIRLYDQSSSRTRQDRRYWVVSPNVRNDERTVGEWSKASVRKEAAFMGYYPHDPKHSQIGPKFAGTTARGVEPGHVMLIARRHHGEPKVVGFGVVQGNYAKRIRAFKPPQSFGSLRRLSPFRAWNQPLPGMPLIDALQHTKALVQLHPESNDAHRKVCEWMERKLGSAAPPPRDEKGADQDIDVVDQPESHQLDYRVQTKDRIIRAKRIEAGLLEGYRRWLEHQDRKLSAARYGRLQCDGYEKQRQNLIEAKASTSREHVRMAVGQLLDYAFQGKEKLGSPNMAILLPNKLSEDIEKWLHSLGIGIIWRDGKSFFDNANGQFT